MDCDEQLHNKRVKGDNEDDGGNARNLNKKPDQVSSEIPPLSEEILEMIFSHLKTGREAQPVSNACSQFQRIMAPSKPAWAFDQVFPSIFAELDSADMLNCRLVCKQWRDGVDRFLQSQPLERSMALYPTNIDQPVHNRPLYAPQFPITLVCKSLGTPHLVAPSQLMNRVERMWSHPRNPLVLRTIQVYFLHRGNATNDFTRALRSFLCTLGHEIWHVSLEWRQVRSSILGYTNLRQALSYLSNLRTLSISCLSTQDLEEPRDYGTRNKLKQIISEGPLPSLAHLQRLRIDIVDIFTDGPIMKELMRSYSNTVKMLLVPLSCWESSCLGLRGRTKLTNATDLQMHCGGAVLFSWNSFCYRLDAPNLCKLTLFVDNEWEVMQLLSPLQDIPTLRYLRLRFDSRSRNFDRVLPSPYEFVLRNVRTLEVLDSENVQYDHLLTCMPHLEYLFLCMEQRFLRPRPTLTFENPEHWNISRWIEGPSFGRSNLWTRLGVLKEVTLAILGDNEMGFLQDEILDRKTYTREMYDWLMEDHEE